MGNTARSYYVWHENLVVPPEELPPQERRSRFDSSITSMRVHELAVQRWLNRRFLVAEGFPMPVLFSTPMLAYADFKQLWSQQDNPFSYLLQAKSRDGKPIYQPHPSPPAYPLITIKRVDWTYNAQRSFSSHWWRHVGWPTIANDVKRADLGVVYQTRMPQAWDYRLQLDHYATRPDGQAHFIQEFQQGFFPSASVPNTWIRAVYPGIFHTRLIRVILDGSITDATEEEPGQSYRVYRTTANITVEGWVVDPDNLVVNAFWYEVDKLKAVSPTDLAALYSGRFEKKFDARGDQANAVFNSAIGLPPA